MTAINAVRMPGAQMGRCRTSCLLVARLMAAVASFGHSALYTRQQRAASRASAVVRAASVAAMPDIKERLNRYEWDRMRFANLTGRY